MNTAIYPARRAIERAVATPGARPTRLFGILVPVWRIEVSVTVTETEPYEVFDQFVTRGIAEAGLRTPSDLAGFFGIEPSIVDRTLRFLISLGHVEWTGSNLRLTALGNQSAREGVRRIVREDRRHLYFDGYTSGPLPTGHYTGVTYLREPSLRGKDGTGFRPAGLTNPFRDAEIGALLSRPDRRAFNISDGVHAARPIATAQVWLPTYLVEDAGEIRMQAFTMASERRDQHIERVCADLGEALREEEEREDSVETWQHWLAARGFGDVKLGAWPMACSGPRSRPPLSRNRSRSTDSARSSRTATPSCSFGVTTRKPAVRRHSARS